MLSELEYKWFSFQETADFYLDLLFKLFPISESDVNHNSWLGDLFLCLENWFPNMFLEKCDAPLPSMVKGYGAWAGSEEGCI